LSKFCSISHIWFNQMEMLKVPFNVTQIPLDGIYILFEKGEYAHGGQRIVRIGTHTGNNQLRSRLNQHFIQENKDRSIFRKNIGRALLSKAKDPFVADWNIDLTSSKAKQRYTYLRGSLKLLETERCVTHYIQSNFSFVVIPINNKEMRLRLESKLISTVSLCTDCKPSSQWLGRSSTKDKICKSGLWQVNELCKEPLSIDEMHLLSTVIQG